MIRVLLPLQLCLGREVRPMRPLASWELPPGSEIALPAELERSLVRAGFAAETREKAVIRPGETR